MELRYHGQRIAFREERLGRHAPPQRFRVQKKAALPTVSLRVACWFMHGCREKATPLGAKRSELLSLLTLSIEHDTPPAPNLLQIKFGLLVIRENFEREHNTGR
jgi:hypothetical protein